jgi:hypothetical protein
LSRLIVLAAVAALVASPAVAQEQPDTIISPRALAAPMEQAILHPHSADVGDVVAMLQKFEACVTDNPGGGITRRVGQDQCPEVTAALDAQQKIVAERHRLKADAAKAAPAGDKAAAPVNL